MPLFSIIAVHYQGAIPHELFRRGIASIQSQTFRDFELLCYHDGPLLNSSVQMPCAVTCTEKRFNDFGHSLRDRGIREASGEYILHFNVDNLLYPQALEAIAAEIRRPARMFDAEGKALDVNDIIIFPILMHGLMRVRGVVQQFRSTDSGGAGGMPFFEIMTGNPPILQNIDAMQLVMKRALWLAEGGWSDKRQMGDGYLYEKFAAKYGYRTVGPVLGEHF